MPGAPGARDNYSRSTADHSHRSRSTTHSSSQSISFSHAGDVDGNLFAEEPASFIRVLGKGRSKSPHSSNHSHQHHRHFNRRLRTDIAMGSDEDPKEYDRLRQLFKRGLILAEVTGIGMCLFIIVWATQYGGGIEMLRSGHRNVINLHVVLMLVFMLYLHGHAALIYRIFPTQPKYTIKLLHGVVHLSACIGIGCGFAAAIEKHNIDNAAHFYSLHSWLGLTAIVLYYIQFLAGFITFLLPYAPVSLRAAVLPYHRFSGQVLFSLATGSAITGIMLKAQATIGPDYKNFPATGIVLNITGFLVLTFSVIIGNLLGDARFRRRPRPEGELLLADTAGRDTAE